MMSLKSLSVRTASFEAVFARGKATRWDFTETGWAGYLMSWSLSASFMPEADEKPS